MKHKFKQDGEGNWYLILASEETEFNTWDEWSNRLWSRTYSDSEFDNIFNEYKGKDFNEDRINSPSYYTFENPE
jgi:hypothetical protein